MFNTTDTKIHQFLNFNQKIKKDSSFYKTRNLSFPKILRRNNFEIIKKKKNPLDKALISRIQKY